jgi:hypothetical protein
LKMEAICSSETSVEFQRTTRRYISEDSTFLIQNYWIPIAQVYWASNEI